jgi:hypothetical protein
MLGKRPLDLVYSLFARGVWHDPHLIVAVLERQ